MDESGEVEKNNDDFKQLVVVPIMILTLVPRTSRVLNSEEYPQGEELELAQAQAQAHAQSTEASEGKKEEEEDEVGEANRGGSSSGEGESTRRRIGPSFAGEIDN